MNPFKLFKEMFGVNFFVAGVVVLILNLLMFAGAIWIGAKILQWIGAI